MTVSRLLARPMLASMFVVGGVNALKDAGARRRAPSRVTDRWCRPSRQAVPQVPIPTDPATLVRINGGVQLARRRRARHRPGAAPLRGRARRRP